MKKIIALLLVAVGVQTPVNAQYYIDYPYIYFQDGYSTPYIGSAYLTLPRPTDVYRSLRLRSLSPGFDGLIRDEYSDMFRNPAIGIPDGSSHQLFGDLGAVNELGKFTLGGFFKTEHNTIGVATTLDRMLKRTTTNESHYTSNPGPNVSTSTYTYGTNPEGIGARISSSFSLQEGRSIGLSYEYLNNKNTTFNSSTYTSTSPGYMSTSVSDLNLSTKGDIHRISAGGVLVLPSGDVHLIARGVFSKWTIANLRTYANLNPYYRRDERTDYPTEVKTNAVLVGGMYQTTLGEGQILRLLVEMGLTNFTASGTSLDYYRDSSSTIYITNQSGTRSVDGKIVDVRCGAGYERRIFEEVIAIAGLSIGYIRNSYDGTQSSTSTQSSSPPSTPPTTTNSSSSDNGALDGFDIRMPLGAEVFLGSYVVLRGGVEPRYLSGHTSSETLSSSGPTYPANGTYKNKVDQRGLVFSSQFGGALHHDDYGELSVLFGRNLADTYFWTFFLKYYL